MCMTRPCPAPGAARTSTSTLSCPAATKEFITTVGPKLFSSTSQYRHVDLPNSRGKTPDFESFANWKDGFLKFAFLHEIHEINYHCTNILKYKHFLHIKSYFKINENVLVSGQGKNHKDAASVRSTHPIPAACGIYYFEVKIISKGRDGLVL